MSNEKNLLNCIEDLNIKVENDMLREVLKYVDVTPDNNNEITPDLLLEYLDPSELDYRGACHEQIDGMIDNYFSDLREWAVDNWEWIEQAFNNGLIDNSNFDYHKQIQAGQYEYYNDQFYSALQELTNELENL